MTRAVPFGRSTLGFIALGAWLAKKFTAAPGDSSDAESRNTLVARAMAPASAGVNAVSM